MTTQAVVLDLDGTILDTLDDLTCSVNFALKKNGFPEHNRDAVCGFVGDGVKILIIRALRAHGVEPEESLIARILADFKEHYAVHGLDHTAPYEGIREFFDSCRLFGLKIGVVSNKHDVMVKNLCSYFFGDFVDVARGEDMAHGIPKKPDPAGLFLVLSALNIDAAHAVYVGDSDQDILTARNAGIPCVSVTWGFRSEEFLRSHGATWLAHTPGEIFSFLP